MNISVHQQEDVTVLAVSGELTHESTARFRETLTSVFEQSRRDFIVDLSGLEGVDSEGLEAFTAFQRQCDEQLGMVYFCGATPILRKVFELTRLDRAFELREAVEEGLAGFR